MVNSELSAFDEPVSNTTVVESAKEAAAPKRGPGMAAESNDHIEVVSTYTMLRRAFSAEATAMGALTGLEASYPDIGSASFGSFVPKTVHEGDDRRQITATDTYPWRAHASLIVTAADGSHWLGTAWFISPRVLVTAGHVVCIKNSGVTGRDGWVRSMRVVPGRSGTTTPFGEVTSASFHSVRGWVEHGNEEYDYGAIVLDQPLGDETGWFSFGHYTDTDLKTVIGNISGYPGDKLPGTQWYAARQIDSVTTRKVHYDIDTAGGQSGSCVYRIKDGERYAIAIHAYGGPTTNSGTRINQAVFDNLSKWISDSA